MSAMIGTPYHSERTARTGSSRLADMAGIFGGLPQRRFRFAGRRCGVVLALARMTRHLHSGSAYDPMRVAEDAAPSFK